MDLCAHDTAAIINAHSSLEMLLPKYGYQQVTAVIYGIAGIA